jgi:hypothetical protein
VPAKKSATKKSTVRKTTPRKSAAKKSTVRKTTSKSTAGTSRRSEPASSRRAAPARRGDRIVIDSSQVGSPPREGEVLRVIRGDVKDSYYVRWADGHETLISPAAGTVTVVRA